MRTKLKKAGIFGGTFDPIHLGHLITAQYVLEQRKLDEIIFMPCFVSPHKTDKFSILPFHRMNMVKLAIQGNASFSCSDFEINRENVSYTIETLLYLRNQYSEMELIIGYDSLCNFEQWKEPDRIIELARLIVMKRTPLKEHEEQKRNRFFDKAVFVNTPIIDISATEIRERISKDLPVNFLLTKNVLEYIINNKLYK